MASLQALHFLVTAARLDQKSRSSYSRAEIVKKLNEVKYLSAQKKIPRLSLRKEILHLEHKVSQIIQFEEKNKKEDSLKIELLKNEVAMLRRRLVMTQDKDVTKKVEKLAHLLAACLAQKEVRREVKLQKGMARGRPGKVKQSMSNRLRLLQAKFSALQQQVQMMKQLPKVDVEKVQLLETEMQYLAERLQEYQRRESADSLVASTSLQQRRQEEKAVPEAVAEASAEEQQASEEVKHTVLFQQPVKKMTSRELEMEKEFPLPPPPKMKEKKEEL